jgi:hypothetical protein
MVLYAFGLCVCLNNMHETRKRLTCRISVEKPFGKMHSGRPGMRWKDNTETRLTKQVASGKWVELA